MRSFGSRSTSWRPDLRPAPRTATTNPAAVGADRIVNAVGVGVGRHYGFPAIIVDINTATTIEAVDSVGAYLGGAILTGLYVALDALVARTAKPSAWTSKRKPRAS